jgi:hypothetical protein
VAVDELTSVVVVDLADVAVDELATVVVVET